MNDEDISICQFTIAMANNGDRDLAYPQFCELYSRNPGDTTLLAWIAYTSPDPSEAYRALADLEHIDPTHEKIAYLRNTLNKRQIRAHQAPRYVERGPTLTCPYCHHTGAVEVKSRVAVFGWIWIGLLGAAALYCLFTPIPTYLLTQFGNDAFALFLISLVGLALRKRYYQCRQCRIALGDGV